MCVYVCKTTLARMKVDVRIPEEVFDIVYVCRISNYVLLRLHVESYKVSHKMVHADKWQNVDRNWKLTL